MVGLRTRSIRQQRAVGVFWAKVGLRCAAVLVLVGGLANAIPAYALEIDKPLTADEVAELALERNYAVLSSESDVLAADGSVRSASSSVMPQISGGVQYRNTVNPTAQRIAANLLPLVESQFWTGFARVDQQVMNFNTWGNMRAAKKSRQSTVERNYATRADIALEAYRLFYELLKSQKLAHVAIENLTLTRDQLLRTEALFELGSIAKGDVLKQKVQVSQAELEEIRERRAVLIARARLANLLGLDPAQPLPIDTTLVEPALFADSAAVLRDALTKRPELAAGQADMEGAQALLGAAQGLRYPSIDGSLAYGFTTPGWWGNRRIDDFAAWNFFVALNIPIFDGMNAKGQIEQANARKLQAQYRYQSTQLDIAVEVEEVLQFVSLSKERIDVTRDGLLAAAEDLKLSQEKYNVGSATVLELIDAQVNHVRSQSEYVSAVADAHVAIVRLRRVRGDRF